MSHARLSFIIGGNSAPYFRLAAVLVFSAMQHAPCAVHRVDCPKRQFNRSINSTLPAFRCSVVPMSPHHLVTIDASHLHVRRSYKVHSGIREGKLHHYRTNIAVFGVLGVSAHLQCRLHAMICRCGSCCPTTECGGTKRHQYAGMHAHC